MPGCLPGNRMLTRIWDPRGQPSPCPIPAPDQVKGEVHGGPEFWLLCPALCHQLDAFHGCLVH